MDVLDKKDNYLDYLTIIKFAVENIYQIKSVDEITSKFRNTIKDITNDRDEIRMAELISMNIPGHEIYFYKFKENKNLFGEFSVDFIPTYPEEFVRNGIRDLGGLTAAPLFDQKLLANFRVQLFADGLFPYRNLNAKNKEITNYITTQFGKSNQSSITKETSKLLRETYGKKIDCWHFQKEDRDYSITLYFFRGHNNIRSYVSFSISLYFSAKD